MLSRAKSIQTDNKQESLTKLLIYKTTNIRIKSEVNYLAQNSLVAKNLSGDMKYPQAKTNLNPASDTLSNSEKFNGQVKQQVTVKTEVLLHKTSGKDIMQ